MYFCPSYTLSLFISLFVRSIDRLSVPLSFSPSNCPSSCPSILSALVRPCVCFLVRPFLPVHPKARTCMTRPSFLYSLHLTARADKRIHLLIFDKKCREFTTVAVTSKRTICECPDCPSVILPPALQHVLSTVCHCISLTSTFFSASLSFRLFLSVKFTCLSIPLSIYIRMFFYTSFFPFFNCSFTRTFVRLFVLPSVTVL